MIRLGGPRPDAEERGATDRAEWRWVWAYAIAMLIIGNAKSIFGPTSLAGSPVGVVIGLVVAAGSLWYARRWLRLSWAELGLTGWRAVPASLGIGALLIYLLVAVAAVVADASAGLGGPRPELAPPGDLAQLSPPALLRRILLYLPFDTIVPEELVFRAVLLGELRRRYRSWIGPVLWSTAGFVAWHGALGCQEAAGALDQLAVKFFAYAVGSVIFTVPLLMTGQLAGCLLAHWLADAVLMIGAHPLLGSGLREVILPP